jgi:hypothetical protein
MLNKIKELNNMDIQKQTMLKVKDLVDNGMKGRVEWNVAKADYYFDLAFETLKTELGLSYKKAVPAINRFITESKVSV